MISVISGENRSKKKKKKRRQQQKISNENATLVQHSDNEVHTSFM